MYEVAIVLGRFQPLHLGHAHLIEEGLKIAKRVLIVIGHSGFEDSRHFMHHREVRYNLKSVFSNDNIDIQYLFDCKDDKVWVSKLAEKVKDVPDESVCFIGSKKDVNWYGSLLPDWTVLSLPQYMGINATQIREDLFCKGELPTNVPYTVLTYLEKITLKTDTYKKMVKNYKRFYNIEGEKEDEI